MFSFALKLNNMNKIALFGTSADPPTTGHQLIISWLSFHYDKVGIWASNNPFKKHQTSLFHRTTMLRLLIENMHPSRCNIHLSKNLSHHRSLVSIARAKNIWERQADYTLVIGSDLVKQIRQWYRIEKLFSEVSILIVLRSGYVIDKLDLQTLVRLGGRCQVVDLNAPGFSSTTYRKYGDRNVLTKSIQDYIAQEQLYI